MKVCYKFNIFLVSQKVSTFVTPVENPLSLYGTSDLFPAAVSLPSF